MLRILVVLLSSGEKISMTDSHRTDKQDSGNFEQRGVNVKVKVMRSSRWEHPGEFPMFEKGTPITLAEDEDADFLGWYACDILGHKPYVPKVFVCDGKLARDYNPTELIQEVGDILEVREIVFAWLLATNENGVTGWIPAESVMSAN